MKDLNKLSKEIYEANKAKGFHEEKHSFEHMACLIISELMEAVEADRKGRIADLDGFNKAMESDSRYPEGLDESFEFNFKNHIKDTVEDELCDAVIRLLDTAGALGVYLQKNTRKDVLNSTTKWGFNIQSFTESIYSIIRVFNLSESSIGYRITSMISHIELLCNVMNIDLWQHVDLKLKYNSLRPYKHGKQY